LGRSATENKINKHTNYNKYSNLQSMKSTITITYITKAQDLMIINKLVNDVNTHTPYVTFETCGVHLNI
jgi:hypothetical protein